MLLDNKARRMKIIGLSLGLILFLGSMSGSSERPEHWKARDRFHVMEGYRPEVPLRPDSLHDFDVLKYELNISFDLNAQTLSGTAGVHVRSEAADLDSIFLHLVQLAVDSVWTAGKPLSFSHGGGVIEIGLDTTISAGDTFEVTIAYHGHPGNEGPSGFGGFYFTPKVAFSMGVGLYTVPPSMGRYWFPCYDAPNDKAEFDMSYTVPLSKVAVSNGILVDTVPDYAESTMTYIWSEHHPTSTYLVAVSISDYVVVPDSVYSWIYSFVYPEDSSKAVTSFRNVNRMMDAYENFFSPYHFDRFGYVEAPKGDMEHQTCVTHLSWLINGSNNYDWILAHELSHHWWGDWVTVGDWRDIWLNEGFATYCEAIYEEYMGGWNAYHDYVVNDIMSYYLFSGELFPIYDPQQMWGATSYEKGASVLHMLRHVVTDSLFFDILNSYGSKYAYGNAVTRDFQAVCESIYGQDLDWFFNEWIYDWAYPQYVYDYWQSGVDTVKVAILQEQAVGPIFVMPVDFSLGTQGGDTAVTGWVDESPETLAFTFPGANADSFAFDPDDWILKLARYEPGVAEREGIQAYHVRKARIIASPNPFTETTNLTFVPGMGMRTDGGASLTIHDLTGRIVKTFRYGGRHEQVATGSNYVFLWDAKDERGCELPSGVYFCRLDSGKVVAFSKLVFLR